MKMIRLALMAVALAAAPQAGAADPLLSIDGVASPTERANVERWMAEVSALLSSERLHRNLKQLGNRYPRIWMSRYEGTRTPVQLSAILRLKDPEKPDLRYVPTAVALVGQASRRNPGNDGFDGDGRSLQKVAVMGWTGEEGPHGSYASMTLGRVHYARYLSEDVVERSCAVNTLAHETSHALSLHARQVIHYILDDEPSRPLENSAGPLPLASYFIGSVAQCTYLEQEGRIGPGDLVACMETFGLDTFRNDRCDDFPDAAMPIRPD